MPAVPKDAKKPADHAAKAPVPKGAKVPQDHAAKAEAKGRNVEFDFEGVHYVIDRDNADNLELMEFVELDKLLLAVRGYLGIDQWEKWKVAHRDDKGRVNARHFEPFLDVVMAAIGGGSAESPNSEASPTS